MRHLFVAALLATGFQFQDPRPYRQALPASGDETLTAVLKLDLIFYTDEHMMRCYQHDGGCHDIFYNISALKPPRGNELFGNPNLEMPWKNPAGTHRCGKGELQHFKFVHLPAPILYRRETLHREIHPQRQSGITWQYPEGTVFGEVLRIPHQGAVYTFEVRTRTKTGGRWVANLYRPVLTRAELVEALKADGVNIGPPRVTPGRLRNRHPVTVIDRTALVDDLPAIPEASVKRLLALPFRSAVGSVWVADGKGAEGYAPTTAAAFSIVPRNYDGAFLKVDSRSCAACHQDILKDASSIERREWYGKVRGGGLEENGGIFSFHPFAKECISTNGSVLPIRMNRKLIEAGLLKPGGR